MSGHTPHFCEKVTLPTFTAHLPSIIGHGRLSPTQTSETVKVMGFSYYCAIPHASWSGRPDSETCHQWIWTICPCGMLKCATLGKPFYFISFAKNCLSASQVPWSQEHSHQIVRTALCLASLSLPDTFGTPPLSTLSTIGTTATLPTTKHQQQSVAFLLPFFMLLRQNAKRRRGWQNIG